MDSKPSWNELLLQVACFPNTTIHSTTKEFPHFVLFGHHERLPHESLLNINCPMRNLNDYIKCRLRAFQTSQRIIHDRLTASQQMLYKQHLRTSGSTLEMDDIVFYHHNRHSKLDTILHGSHHINEKIINIKGFVKHVAHEDHLKKFRGALIN